MKTLLVLTLSLPFFPLLADSSAAYPPNPYEESGGTAPAFSDANSVAMHFINIIDNQEYAGAWLDASGLMHDVVPQEVWTAGMDALRSDLGNVRARKTGPHQSVNSLPGGTEGDFMIISYDTQFAQKARATERVTLMREPPLGLWKVVSYSISS